MEPARSRCETPRGTDPTFRYIGKRAGSLNKWGELSAIWPDRVKLAQGSGSVAGEVVRTRHWQWFQTRKQT
jgi:hypothetical protein